MEFVSYLFSPIPGSAFNYSLALIIYAGILFAAAIIIKIILSIKRKNKALRKTLRSAPSEFVWTSIILFILVASRINGIPYLSMRFLLILVMALSVFYIGKSIQRMIKKYPEMKNVTKPKKDKKSDHIYTTRKKRK
jgi:flagellar biosynthesis component FlhA